MKQKKLYPIKFVPVLKEKVWGGDCLVKVFGKPVPEAPADAEENPDYKPFDVNHVGESWEICDMEGAVSEVANGFLAENSLADLMEVYLGNIVGDNIYDFYGLMFPLLIKFLDIRERLSIQVHPDDETALERAYSLGKTEFWYVMDASPDAIVYMGLNRTLSASEFYEMCKNGTIETALNAIRPKKGDCFFIKAGTVHAATGGVQIAEIQENSDMTYRLYDWGRENNPATRREMHLEEAIDCIDFNTFNAADCFIPAAKGDRMLADDSHFTIEMMELAEKRRVETDSFSSFLVYMCVEGSAAVTSSSTDEVTTLKAGETVLVPAEVYDVTFDPLQAGTRLLQVYIRQIEEKPDGYINPNVPEEVQE